MAKKYGERWEVLRSIGTGGQSEVFLVADKKGEFQQPCALKRLKNPKRNNRFVAEIEACTRLTHSGLMPILDSYAFTETTGNEPRYLVMPFAEDGDLTKREKLYQNDLDAVVKVGLQLANSLNYCHENGIIHRDVKPENILFSTRDHKPQISDFGICLIADFPRATEFNEVVGPRYFMAPEMEDGGRLDVTPSADIYSLGKVLYYMITGGTRLPREALRDDPNYLSLSQAGHKTTLLLLLLSKMITPRTSRIASMKDVEQDLTRILDWDRSSTISVSPTAIDAFNKLVLKESESKSIKEHNQKVYEEDNRRLEDYGKIFSEWLRIQLKTIAETLSTPGLVEARTFGISPEHFARIQTGPTKGYEVIYCIALQIHRKQTSGFEHHHLAFLVARRFELSIGFGDQKRRELKDIEVVFAPFYFQQNEKMKGYITRREHKKTNRKPGLFAQTFDDGKTQICSHSTISAWPTDAQKYSTVVNEALEAFLQFIASNPSQIGMDP